MLFEIAEQLTKAGATGRHGIRSDDDMTPFEVSELTQKWWETTHW